MTKITILILFLVAPTVFAVGDGKTEHDFCYEDDDCGPDTWDGECKTGFRQSPIDLPAMAGGKNVALDFNNQYKSDDFWVFNNGHTIEIRLSPNATSSAHLSGYELDRPYILAQLHFHWGHEDQEGSEHTVNGTHFAIEVHLVHYDSKYETFTAATESGDPKAIAVVGVFLQPGTEDDENPGFDTIASNLPLHLNPNGEQIHEKLMLESLLPRGGQKFYRYFGSLTTPPCTEVVEWTVIQKSLRVKPSEIMKFREAETDDEKHLIGSNFRPVQSVNEREVEYLTIQDELADSGSSRVKINISLAILVLIFLNV